MNPEQLGYPFAGREQHEECIQCPRCQTRQLATVEHTVPQWTYHHQCSYCDYRITRLTWREVLPLRLLTCLLFLLPLPAMTQSSTLPADAVLYASLDSFYQQQTRAELAEFTETTASNWMSWMPSIGVAYTPSGEPRPGINYSLATVFGNIKSKQRQQAKRDAILQKNELRRQADYQALATALTELQQLEADYHFALDIHAIDSTLFEVDRRKAEHAEITPTVFLKAKRAFLLKKLAVLEKKRQIIKQRLKILALARHKSKNLHIFNMPNR